jgi:hypothetical protein
MRKILLIAITGMISICSYSQKNKKDVPDFGKIEKADLEMKECAFDPKANAMVLFDVGELSCVLGSNSAEVYLERRVRIKILKEKGRDVADVKIPYLSYSKQQSIDNLTAQTYNLDASGNIVVTKVDGKLIYDKPINKRYSEKIFTFPDVKPGSILEYKYKKRGMGLLTWYFQRSYPVLYSRYRVDFPQELEVFTKPYVSLDLKREKDDQGTRIVETFSMEKVPALRDEAFILNEEDYMERVESQLVAVGTGMNRTSLIRQWPNVIKDLMEDDDFGTQLKKDIPRTSDLDALLKGKSDPYDKMVIIHNYVKNNMQWNGYDGIWALDGVKSAWKDKKGTSGEINLILTNLLKNSGLQAFPILVSSHDNGLVKPTEADISQFNKVLAYVKIGDDFFVLDATQKDVPSFLIPPDVTLNEGLLISKPESNEWGWKTLWNDNCATTVSMLYSGTVDDKGKMSGDAIISSYDYARLERLPTIRKGVKDYQEKYLATSNPNISIDSISFENVEVDTLPLNQKIHFTQQLASSGNYKYFNANFFTGLEKNPFIAEKRFSDVFFGVTQNYTIIGTFFIPDGYVVEGLPKNIKMIMPDKSIEVTRMTQSDDISIYVRIDLKFKKPFYDESEYPEFREFYKKLQDLLNEQFVITKK